MVVRGRDQIALKWASNWINSECGNDENFCTVRRNLKADLYPGTVPAATIMTFALFDATSREYSNNRFSLPCAELVVRVWGIINWLRNFISAERTDGSDSETIVIATNGISAYYFSLKAGGWPPGCWAWVCGNAVDGIADSLLFRSTCIRSTDSIGGLARSSASSMEFAIIVT